MNAGQSGKANAELELIGCPGSQIGPELLRCSFSTCTFVSVLLLELSVIWAILFLLFEVTKRQLGLFSGLVL